MIQVPKRDGNLSNGSMQGVSGRIPTFAKGLNHRGVTIIA